MITRLASYKNGLLDGESTEFELVPADNNYSGWSILPSTIIIYKNGKKEGLTKQFYKGILVKTISYTNDQANGESKTYDLNGNVESTLVYKDNIPYDGVTYDYDYEHQLKSITSYSNGYPDGEQKYFEDGELVQVDSYDNGSILKKIVYRVGNEYELTYRDSKPFNGIQFESDSDYSVEEYKNGVITARKSYRDLRSGILISSKTYEGDRSIKTAYFDNGLKKEEITFVGSGREGAATYYDRNGKEIAKGIYSSDFPLSGSFAYYADYNEYDYLILLVEKNNLTATEYINGKPGKKMEYSKSGNKELEVFLETLESVFEDYEIR
jgi:antitoxin component YwqK of YwqJK toxin-antitoxin module